MKLLRLFFCLFLGLPISLYAQTQVAITLEQAMEQALGENKQMEIDYFAQQSMLYKRKAMKGLRSPRFGLSASYTHLDRDVEMNFNNLKPAVGDFVGSLPPVLPPQIIAGLMSKDWAYTIQDKNFAIVGANVTMPIFMGGKINAANRAAQTELDIAKEESEQNKAALRSELIERYYGVSLAMQALDVRTEVLEGMRRHLSDAQKLEKAGVVSRVDCLYAEMKVAEAEAEVQKAKSNLRTIMVALKNTLNKPEYENEMIVPMTTMFILQDIEDVSYFKELAINNNSILKQIGLKTKLAKEGVKVERAAYMPEIAAMGGVDIYNYQLTHIAPKWAVGAGLKFNIFDGMYRENSVRAAKSKLKEVEAIGESADSDIRMLIEKQYNELVSAKDMYNTYASRIEFAKEYLRLKELAFSNGMASSQDVTDARLLLSKNKIESLQSAYQYDILLSKLLENCGISDQFVNYKNSTNYIPVYYNNEK